MNDREVGLYLDHYESDGVTVWCWKRGVYSSQEFPSEDAAMEASEDEALVFSRADGLTALDVLLTRKAAAPPFDYWIVAGAFVAEPYVGGQQLGALPSYELPAGAATLEMTQEEFDELMDDFCMREGYYPDS